MVSGSRADDNFKFFFGDHLLQKVFK